MLEVNACLRSLGNGVGIFVARAMFLPLHWFIVEGQPRGDGISNDMDTWSAPPPLVDHPDPLRDAFIAEVAIVLI